MIVNILKLIMMGTTKVIMYENYKFFDAASAYISNCVILKGMSHAGVIFLFCADQTP